MRTLVIGILLTAAVIGCGTDHATSTVKEEGARQSLIGRIESLEKRVGSLLIKHRDECRGLICRVESMITTLNSIEIEANFGYRPLVTSVAKIELLIAASLEGWTPLVQGNGVGLKQRVEHAESALVKLVSAYHQKKGGLVLRVKVLKEKFAQLDIKLADYSALLPAVEDMELKLEAFEVEN